MRQTGPVFWEDVCEHILYSTERVFLDVEGSKPFAIVTKEASCILVWSCETVTRRNRDTSIRVIQLEGTFSLLDRDAAIEFCVERYAK